ncbi:MAG TPA: hypothetical protein VK118_02135 [Tetragenococcus sp.]|nr:hypothetical protein [Tetragenococcus sp.]
MKEYSVYRFITEVLKLTPQDFAHKAKITRHVLSSYRLQHTCVGDLPLALISDLANFANMNLEETVEKLWQFELEAV